MPKVSIIVPCYNQAPYVAECLDSVVAQTYHDWECIVVNDGSTDDSDATISAYIKSRPKFRYINQPNQGVVATRNNAIRASRGQYILPLDADDVIAPTLIEKAVAILDADSEVKVVSCDVEYFGGLSGRMMLRKFSLRTELVHNCMVCTSMFRRGDFDRVGGFNPNMNRGWEDWDFWISLLEEGGKVVNIDETLFKYRIKEKSRNVTAGQISTELRHQIMLNHMNLFYNEYQEMYKELISIQNSRTYLLSKLLTKPVQWLYTVGVYFKLSQKT